MNLGGSLAMVKERWQALSRNQKIISVLVAAGVLVCFIYLGLIVTRPSYAPLLSGLDPKEAGAIAEKLKTMKIPYQLADQGQTIKVPESQVYEARIQLASSGVLGGDGKGFELFDQNKFGQSDFDQQVNYQRALQEELRRTIIHIEGVQDARVHLVLPQKSVFVNDQGTPTASVALTLKPGAQLKPEQVQGICDLFVGSVEGLKPENIHIIDNAGNVLSENLKLNNNPDVVLTKTTLEQQKLQREYEKELEIRIQQMLAKITGQNNSVAMVTADLDFSKQQVTNTTNTNPDNVKVSEHTIKETGKGSTSGGAVGTDSNITTTPFAQSVDSSNFSKEDNTINYQVSSKQETLVAAPGRVKRLSAAVVVKDNADSPVDVTKIKDAVAAAMGYDQSRGDQISVTSMAFDDSLQKKLDAEAAQEKSAKDRSRIYIIAAVAGIILLALLVLLVIYLVNRRRSAQAQFEEEQEIEETFIPVGVLEAEPEHEIKDDKQEQIRKIATERPDDIAEIIKVWMRD
ncbi:flagellar M-ring protein FliF [Pelotomaculum isophthalicicum JI]|uniref:Flagellar M-ring protein n=1 Tax=Pelotomaculum isophthalicicum JI TaxID=947010 RepID=A0A9X4H7A5_9FIRM|nr:flagellar basal-body MS-ring/collar protein FliF [Pelotomaculum isophthalicicum]MDF9409299.1 flagellar M-ring protein FliF [Pelotomaculum isophthalicicum JI]